MNMPNWSDPEEKKEGEFTPPPLPFLSPASSSPLVVPPPPPPPPAEEGKVKKGPGRKPGRKGFAPPPPPPTAHPTPAETQGDLQSEAGERMAAMGGPTERPPELPPLPEKKEEPEEIYGIPPQLPPQETGVEDEVIHRGMRHLVRPQLIVHHRDAFANMD